MMHPQSFTRFTSHKHVRISEGGTPPFFHVAFSFVATQALVSNGAKWKKRWGLGMPLNVVCHNWVTY